MDAQQLLEQLLESGKKLAQQGLERSGELVEQGKEMAAEGLRYAEDRLPPAGPCLLYTSPSPRDRTRSRMPSSA